MNSLTEANRFGEYVDLSPFTFEHRYPSTDEGLAALVEAKWGKADEEKYAYLKRIPKDPWGNDYQYRYPGIHNPESFDLWTYGADGLPGGVGNNADCGNWQEDDCFKEPYDDLKRIMRFGLLLCTPIFWLPIYLVFSVRKLLKKQQPKVAFTGWHLWGLLASLMLTLVLPFLLFKSGC